MKISKLIRVLTLNGLLVSLLLSSPIFGQQFKEGTDYISLPGEAQIQSDGKVEVIEFFWFGCPACFRFEPAIQSWKETKPDTINFVTVPGTLTDRWMFHARAYYALEVTGYKDQLYSKFFDEIHLKNNRIFTEKSFEKWLNALDDVDPKAIMDALNSFATITKVNQADILAGKYKITGVPTLIVGGKYRTSPSMVNSDSRALEVVEFLVQKIISETS